MNLKKKKFHTFLKHSNDLKKGKEGNVFDALKEVAVKIAK